MELIGNERVSTATNTIAWDILALDQNHFLFGYNVPLGLKKTITIQDVFNCYEYKDGVHDWLRVIFRNSQGVP